MASDERLTTDEIQKLLEEKLGKASKPAAAAPAAAKPAAAEAPPAPKPEATGPSMDAQIDRLLNSAEAGIKQASGSPPPDATHAQPFQLNALSPESDTAPPLTNSPLDLLGDVELDLRIELGRTNMRLEDVLQLRGGAIVALDKLAGDPVDVYVNDRMIARVKSSC